MEPPEIFELIVKADEKLKYATAAKGDVRAKQAGDLLAEALREAEAIGNDALVQQAKVRIADLDAMLQAGGAQARAARGSAPAPRRPRSRPEALAVRTEPAHGRIGSEPEPPPALVHEPMVEPAQQHQVRKVGPAAPGPPHDVVGIGVAHPLAPGEPARAVATPQRPHHGHRWGAAAPSEHQGRAVGIVEDHLQARIARQATQRSPARAPGRARPRRWERS